MADSDPLKSGTNTSEFWVTIATGAALPILVEIANLPPTTQIMVGVIATSYILSRAAPKVAKAFGQAKSESGVYWRQRHDKLAREWNQWADATEAQSPTPPSNRPQ